MLSCVRFRTRKEKYKIDPDSISFVTCVEDDLRLDIYTFAQYRYDNVGLFYCLTDNKILKGPLREYSDYFVKYYYDDNNRITKNKSLNVEKMKC